MVELIRRVIPRDIVGGHVGKLKRMDALVHGESYQARFPLQIS